MSPGPTPPEGAEHDEHDELLGAALSGLPVPDHGPSFWADLSDRLEGESNVVHQTGSATEAGTVVDPQASAEPVSLDQARAPPGGQAGRPRAVARGRRRSRRPCGGRGGRRDRAPRRRRRPPGPGRRRPTGTGEPDRYDVGARPGRQPRRRRSRRPTTVSKDATAPTAAAAPGGSRRNWRRRRQLPVDVHRRPGRHGLRLLLRPPRRCPDRRARSLPGSVRTT